MMSSLSLSRLSNGNGAKKNASIGSIYVKTNSLPTKKHVPKIEPYDIDINNNAPQPVARRKHLLLNRRGSLHHNQFKGVKKELIEKHASLIIHTMTVKIIFLKKI